jgi:dTDP-4-dehydrorhamnose 3,5-epimerase
LIVVRPLAIPDVLEIIPTRFSDGRGFFSEVWNQQTLAENGIKLNFVQDNHSYSRDRGVLRGLHYQTEPFAQAKLVRVSRGRVFDVAVDLRAGSATRTQWVGLELSADAGNQMLIPAGFAHGFVTLEPDTDVIYKTSTHYSPAHDRSIRFDDPTIGVRWPIEAEHLTLSAKDANAPLLTKALPDLIR